MRGASLQRQDIHVALLQEVTHKDFETFQDYVTIVNEETEKRGTAIMAKVGLQIQNIKRIPSGGVLRRCLWEYG
jgi:hypothetical protein